MWEYKVFRFTALTSVDEKISKELTILAADGWEVVAMAYSAGAYFFTLKRLIK